METKPYNVELVRALKYITRSSRLINAMRPHVLDGSKPSLIASHSALIVELSELMQKVDWKPWKQSEVAAPADLLDEMADVLFFLANFFENVFNRVNNLDSALTDENNIDERLLAEAYAKKLEINIARANNEIDGYIASNE